MFNHTKVLPTVSFANAANWQIGQSANVPYVEDCRAFSTFYASRFNLVGNFATMRVPWTTFYFDDPVGLEEHLKAGCELDGSSLYDCVNESAIKCFPILLLHGAVIDDNIWNLAINLDRDDHVVVLLKLGYLPTKIPKDLSSNNYCCLVEISVTLCQRSVLQTLQIGQRSNQPMHHLWKIIARFLHSTRHDLIWLSALSASCCT